MKRKIVFGLLAFLLVLQAQAVFAADYNEDFKKELDRNNIQNIEKLLNRRAKEMDLANCMYYTIKNKAECLDVLKLLVRYGADVNEQYYFYYGSVNVKHEYPLELAVDKKRSLEVIQFLLNSGAKTYLYENNLPFIKAIEGKHQIEVIQAMLNAGANPNQYPSGFPSLTPITYAYRNNDMPVLNLLLDRGANGADILPEAGSGGDNEMIKQLISKGVQIRSEQGAAALKWAAFNGKIDTVKLLVENGVNVNARDSKGVTALSTAYDKGEMEIYNYLKANGAVDFEPKQATAQPTAPAPSSTTNVYVQPAPAQSNNQAQAKPVQNTPAAPQLNMGTYTDRSVTGSEINLFINTNRATHRIKDRTETSTGNISISGDQLVITWISGPLNGRRSVYHIDSTNQFSGSGETWKMGF